MAELDPLRVVVVGPPPPGSQRARAGVVWCREEPLGGGPAAALAAGVRQLPDADVIVAVAGDQSVAATAVPRLISALMSDGTIDAALGIDSDPDAELSPTCCDTVRDRDSGFGAVSRNGAKPGSVVSLNDEPTSVAQVVPRDGR